MEKETVYAVIITDKNNQIGGCFSNEKKAEQYIGNNPNGSLKIFTLRGYIKSN